MTWKDVALKLIDEFDEIMCLCEVFDEMIYLLDDEESCCGAMGCQECLIRHMERENKKNEM